MQFISSIFMLLLSTFAYSQSHFNYPIIKKQGKTSNDFIPTGWTILGKAEGDLNKDQVKDVALVLQCKKSIRTVNDGDTLNTHPRILVILFQDAVSKTYKLITQSNTFIINTDDPTMEDPFQEVAINKGLLQIDFQQFYNMGSWYITNRSYKFRYQNNQPVLIGADYLSFHRATHDYEEYSFDFLSKKRSFTKGKDEKPQKTTWTPVKLSELKTLETLKKPFEWKIEGIVL